MDAALPLSVTLEVRDRCLCLRAQRAARLLARHFDAALRPWDLTNGQFSLLMSLNRPDAPRLVDLVPLLGTDRTSLTAALKPLERRGLVEVRPDPSDRRARRLILTDAGRNLLTGALPVWRAAHDALDAALPGGPDDVQAGLDTLGQVLTAGIPIPGNRD